MRLTAGTVDLSAILIERELSSGTPHRKPSNRKGLRGNVGPAVAQRCAGVSDAGTALSHNWTQVGRGSRRPCLKGLKVAVLKQSVRARHPLSPLRLYFCYRITDNTPYQRARSGWAAWPRRPEVNWRVRGRALRIRDRRFEVSSIDGLIRGAGVSAGSPVRRVSPRNFRGKY